MFNVKIPNLIDFCSIFIGLLDSGLLDSGLLDSGLLDSGLLDSGLLDSGCDRIDRI
jgi:hypothetical protein